MEYLGILLFCLVLIMLLGFLSYTKTKKIKALGEKEELNEITKNFPENKEIAETILKKLGKKGVIIEEDQEAQVSLYIALTNKIIIASAKKTFARVQTIAHECLHSVQDRKLLLFNFYYSNVYLLSFLILLLFVMIGNLSNGMIAIVIFTLLSFVYFFVRSYLEMDAMTKAKYVAKEYMRENKLASEKEIEKLEEAYEQINQVGIPYTNYRLFLNCMIKIMIITGICYLKMFF